MDDYGIKTYTYLQQKLISTTNDQKLQEWSFQEDLKEDVQRACDYVYDVSYGNGISIPKPECQYELGERFYRYDHTAHKIVVSLDEDLTYSDYCTRLIPLIHEHIHALTRDGSPQRGGYQPDWFREGAAFFLSVDAAKSAFFTDSQKMLWTSDVLENYLSPKSIYALGTTKVERISSYAEENGLGRIKFILKLLQHNGKTFDEGQTLHDVVYDYIYQKKNKDDILGLIDE